jgi:hypothetical protein
MSEAERIFTYLINGKQEETNDSSPSADKILADAGFEPADDFVLIQRSTHGTVVVGSDAVLDLTRGKAEFFAFAGGEIFELTVNEHSLFWGASTIGVGEIRRLANIPEDDDLIWIRDEGANQKLSVGDSFELKARGVEHLRSHERHIEPAVYEYFVGGKPYFTELAEITGAQITAKVPNWNAADSLVIEGDGAAPDEVIRPTTVVKLKGRKMPAHFTIVPPATFGRA